MADLPTAQAADKATARQSTDPDFAIARPLPPALLYRRCDPAELPFALCSELEAAPGLIGQERAVEAVEFALRMARKGYNVYALGAGGTGRHVLVDDLLRRHAELRPTPPDWCYVNNFTDPQRPRRLQLPAGRAAPFAAAMKRLVEELRAALPAAFERDEYRSRRDVIEQQFKQRNEEAFGALQQRAAQHSITLMRTPMGLALAPVRDGKVMPPDAFEALPPEEGRPAQCVHTDDLPIVEFQHDVDLRARRMMRRLSRPTGLLRQQVCWTRVEVGARSTAFHTHTRTDKWIFILTGRARARLGDKTFEVGPHDFIAYPAGCPAHVMEPIAPLTYLMGGERDPDDVVIYPEAGLRRIQGKLVPRDAGN